MKCLKVPSQFFQSVSVSIISRNGKTSNFQHKELFVFFALNAGFFYKTEPRFEKLFFWLKV